MKKKINLVLSGSGTLFYYHIGSLKRILESFEIEKIACTSGGSIIGSLFACGYSISEIEIIAKEINLKECADWSFNILDKLGFLSGDKIKNILKKYLNKKLTESKIPLIITATNYTDKKIVYFNSNDYPNYLIYELVRASMSIPLLFKYCVINNIVFIDGGIIDNFPIDFFKENTLGVKIESSWVKSKNQDLKSNISNWLLNAFGINYILDIVSIMMSSIEKKHIEDAIFSKSIVIKSERSGTNFNYNNQDINSMILEGYNIADKYLKENSI